MKYLADMHMHSIYSYDGQMWLDQMIERGKELNIKYMAFTEHLEFDQITIKQYLNRYQVYKEELEKLQEHNSKIILIKAVEVSNPKLHLKELEILNNLDLDYIIGSNHILPKDNSEKEVLTYYKQILDIIKNSRIDTIGHLDYLKRRVDDSNIENDIIEEIFNELIKRNIALEINTSAVRRKGLDSFPSQIKLELYKKLGGNMVTIGSDAHRINEIYDAIPIVDSKYDFDKGVFIKRKFISLNK